MWRSSFILWCVKYSIIISLDYLKIPVVFTVNIFFKYLSLLNCGSYHFVYYKGLYFIIIFTWKYHLTILFTNLLIAVKLTSLHTLCYTSLIFQNRLSLFPFLFFFCILWLKMTAKVQPENIHYAKIKFSLQVLCTHLADSQESPHLKLMVLSFLI